MVAPVMSAAPRGIRIGRMPPGQPRPRLRPGTRSTRAQSGTDVDAPSTTNPSAPPPSPLSRRGLVLGGAAAAAGAAGIGGPGPALAGDGARVTSSNDPLGLLEERVSEFTLPNGLHFLVLERHSAPIVSCHTLANVGAFDEAEGQTGISHLLEHLAFKGTRRIGTRDFGAESDLLDAMDEVFYEAKDETRPRKQRELASKLEALNGEAQRLWVPNEFGSILTRNGGVGLNASTSHDSTQYYVSLPSNKLELWFALESERFRDPVFRQLYSEKEVVQEERLQRIENARLGKFQERFALESLWARGNPYGRPVIGFEEDVRGLGRREVDAFFRARYQPERLTITVVGDVTSEQVEKLASKYFGPWAPSFPPAGSPPAPAIPTAGGAGGEWAGAGLGGALRVTDPAGPYLMEGYYRPDGLHPDAPAIDVMSDVLSGGRTARFFDRLVVPGKALSAGCIQAYPSDRRESMLLTFGVPAPGQGPEELAESIRDELAAITDSPVIPRELARIKKAQRAGLLEALGSNATMASILGRAHVVAGTWRDVLYDLDRIESVTAGDVQAVAGRYLVDSNRFSGMVAKK